MEGAGSPRSFPRHLPRKEDAVLVFSDPGLLEAAREDALKDGRLERCGLLLGEEEGDPAARSTVFEVRPVRNVHPDPARSYEIDPRALFTAHRREREGGPRLLGAYHSHPGGEPEPSQRDLDLAGPGFSYLIFTAGGGFKSWRLVGERFEEERVEVREGPDCGA